MRCAMRRKMSDMKAYIIDAVSSNSFKSSNPYSGIHETQVAKCLDTACLNPSCNQGGVFVVYEQRELLEPVGSAEQAAVRD